MATWVRSLICQQDECIRLVANQSKIRGQHKKQLEHTVTMRTPKSSPSDRDHVKYLQEQFACKDAHLEHARPQRDTRSVQEELLAHMLLLSSEAQDWKSRVVKEAGQPLACAFAKASWNNRICIAQMSDAYKWKHKPSAMSQDME